MTARVFVLPWRIGCTSAVRTRSAHCLRSLSSPSWRSSRCRQLHRLDTLCSRNSAHQVSINLLTRQLSTTTLRRSTPAAADSPQIPLEASGPSLPNLSDAATAALQTSSSQQWATDAAQILAEGETFASLGLGGYSPVGLLQSSMELIYNTMGLPWWGTIIAATLCIRVAFLPVNILLQKNAIKMNNVNPLVKQMKENQQLYLIAGDLESANHERSKMNAVFKENNVRPILSVVPAIFQGVVMVSFFMAMRGMANAPVTSMMAGGALWFTDLTVADPSFILPMLSSLGFLISLELGGEAGVANPDMMKYKMGLRCFAVLMFFITMKFPAGLFMYWLTSTAFTITNSMILRIPVVRAAVGLNITRDKHETAEKANTFVENLRLRGVVSEKKAELKQAKKRHEKQMKDTKPVLYSKKPLAKQKKKRKFFGS